MGLSGVVGALAGTLGLAYAQASRVQALGFKINSQP